MSTPRQTPDYDGYHLDCFCSRGREGDVWRLYLGPGWCPAFLRALLDPHREAYPVVFDFDDLDRYLASQDARVQQRWSGVGGVELTAHGRSALALAKWLTTALQSGIRHPDQESVGSGSSGG